MSLGLDRFREETFWDVITLPVPERWGRFRQPEGHWGCWEEGAETGTLWVDYDLFGPFQDGPEDWDPLRKEGIFDRLVGPNIGGDGTFHHWGSVDLPSGGTAVNQVITRPGSGDDAGMDLRFSHWHLFRPRFPYLVSVHLTMVMPTFVKEDPEIARFMEAMDAAIPAARIDWTELIARYESGTLPNSGRPENRAKRSG